MYDQSGLLIHEGNPMLPGATKVSGGINFAVEVPADEEASLILYHKGEAEPVEEIPFTEANRTGRMCAMMVSGFKPEQYEYNFRIDTKVCQDPYAYGLTGREAFGKITDKEDEHKIRCSFLNTKGYNWMGDAAPKIPYQDMLLYKIHVRGYTRQAKISPKKRGTFAGLTEMIPYWKELGINAIELMPCYEFMEKSVAESGKVMIQQKHQKGRINYWGYQPGFYFAPKSAYCATRKPQKEFCDMVRAFHEAGIECIMEMYFPADTAPMKALYALWFWKKYYHVDGFHLVGDGVPKELIERDPFLYGVKKMFSDISGQPDKENMLAEYNRGFMQDMRRLLKSDEGMIAGAQFHIKRNTGDFGTINYMASQDGFTLYDTVTYNYRHNEANGEENHDGSDYNYSWNCGVEGATRKQAIRRLREQQLRNAFLMLLLSQGTPMLYGGDEFGNSQGGNNNAWCQDNSTGWTDWKSFKKQEKLFSFVKKAIEFRKEHPILHMPDELRNVDYMAKGFPDISFHGERAWFLNMENTSRLIGIMYCGDYAERADGTKDDFLYIGYNFHWEERKIALPNLPDGVTWRKIVDTSDQEEEKWFREDSVSYKKVIDINPRTIVVLVARQEEVEDDASVAALQDDNKA